MSSRISRGWQIAQNALKVLNANKQLMIFPILSGITITFVVASFFIGAVYVEGTSVRIEELRHPDLVAYAGIFAFYMITYFIVVFFNMALVHCTTLYFRGEEASVRKGLIFSFSRIGLIIAWAAFAATVGTLLRMLQERLGYFGKIVTGILGFVWSAATFFVVPIIAYEKTNPITAAKRSALMVKEKWGESVVANFSFGVLTLIAFGILGIAAIAVSELISMTLGIGLFVLGIMLIFIITSAIKTIIVSAAYHNMDSDIDVYFNKQLLDGLFVEK